MRWKPHVRFGRRAAETDPAKAGHRAAARPHTKVWTAQHGWVYLHAIVDCCTRELVGWSVDLRCRDDEAITVVDAAVLRRRVEPGRLTPGSDNGPQFTSQDFRKHLPARR